MAANLTSQVRAIAEVATAVTKGDLTRSITVEARGEMAELKDNINEMIRNLRETTHRNTEQDWLKTNLARFTRMLQGQRDLMTVSKMVLSELAPLVSSQHGVFYIMDTPDAEGEAYLKLLASYAYKERKHLANRFYLGEGLVGQCALEKERILLTDVPVDYVQISSGLGAAPPRSIIALPVLFEGQVKAVIELASFNSFSETHQAFLEQLTESIGIVLNTIEANSRTEGLLKQSQTLAQELQGQQEELRQTNEELEEKARLLSEQKAEVELKSREIDQARRALEEKAEQLALTSRYKSEFLANMSHELRTPLNSLLILSQQLAENPDNNLSDKQVNFVRSIHASGNDLLNLINDILDLSKIESGTVTIEVEEILLTDLRLQIERTFRHMAADKGLEFHITVAPDLPPTLYTDSKRLQQVLKNLLANAFKFTEKGQVDLKMELATGGWSSEHATLNRTEQVIAFTVVDTGIGIPADKQKLIFEAFQQADGSTSRKYGGTGLGLAISREIAILLGGELRLASSSSGQGSTFTLYLPIWDISTVPQPTPESSLIRVSHSISPLLITSGNSETGGPENNGQSAVQDDRQIIQTGDRTILVVEDDPRFAHILLEQVRSQGFKGIVALRGEEVMSLVRQFQPSAITLDLLLPDIDGWTLLNRLKVDPATRHIPIQIISVEETRDLGLKRGALAFLEKPVDKGVLEESFVRLQAFIQRTQRKLLVVEDKADERQNIIDLIGNGDVTITAVESAPQALAALKAEQFDCMVLDLKLPGMSGFELLRVMRQEQTLNDLPVIVYTARSLTKKEETELNKMSREIIIKDVRSPERLLDETALFLHRVTANMPAAKREMLERLYQVDTALAGKKVLIVDDDIRNIFALTAVLERHKMEVLSAENGQEALDLLQKRRGIDIVLMDIMMPGMDGYETMQAIRRIAKFKTLPIIALTAKAMKGDRDKCIEAGASDYITKPVNLEQLLSLLRVWLYR
jgi:CheY-like chemotaxis protein/HAMP domain-containing protein